MREQKEYRTMLKNLLELDEGLSAWEIDFIENMNHWQGDFRENQANKIEALWDKHF